MRANLHLNSWIAFLAILVMSIASISASETQLLCLNNGESVKFSQCNELIADRTCTSSVSCQFCVSYNPLTKVYCPASLNTCNQIPDLSCTSLVDTGTGQENQTGNQSGNPGNPENPTITIDIAYILADPSSPQSNVIQAINELGFTYNLIDDDLVPSTDFRNYSVILVWDERLKNYDKIPITSHKSLVANTYHLKTWKIAESAGSQISSQYAYGDIILVNSITSGFSSPIKLHNAVSKEINYLAKLPKRARGAQTVLGTTDFSRDPVISIFEINAELYPSGNAAARILFFGIVKTQYWSQESKSLFKKSLQWLKTGEDLDGDSYYSDLDCNDHNASVHPGAIETPYDGIDQDCNGSDLTDVDEDSFSSTIVGGNDCNDSDSTINPASLDLYKNCRNDAPILNNIDPSEFNEGDLVSIVVSATDPENNTIFYSINSTRFTVSGNILTWQTSYDNAGHYTFRVTASDGSLSSSKTFSLKINEKNRPPISTQIPNISWNEDTNNSLNLNNYFSDLDSDNLIFGVSSSSQDVNIRIDSLESGIVNFSVAENWFGEDWIIFFAFDGKEITESNRVVLRILPVNDAPFIASQIPQLTFNEDSPYLLNLSDYIRDIDSNLSYEISSLPNFNVSFSQNILRLAPEKDWNGEVTATITARDSQFSLNSNSFVIKVLPMDEPPEFEPLSCVTTIEEDTSYSCNLSATDLESDPITFSSSNNRNLTCTVSNSTLSYISSPNFNGQARCELIASDKDGSTSLNFAVTITPVNDAPVISLFLPLGLTRVIAGRTKLFNITALDIDSPFIISWLLDANETNTLGSSYLFNKTKGSYNLTAVVSDSFLSTSHSWDVIVADISTFTCEEAEGDICTEKEICPSDILNVKDTISCCSVSCIPKPPSFEDADACSVKNSSLQINIENPDSSDDFELSETISVEVEIKNTLDDEQDISVEAHLYDITDEQSMEKEESDLVVESDRTRKITLDISIPEDLDLDNNYVLFVRAEDEICNQVYQPVTLKRPKEKAKIIDFKIDRNVACGDIATSTLRLENLGSSNLDVRLELKNNELGINEKVPFFEIKKAGEKDKVTKSISFSIPENVEAGEYPLDAIMYYNGSSVSKTETLLLGECFNEQSQETTNQPEKIMLNSLDNNSAQQENKSISVSTIFIASILFITTLVLALVLFIVLARKGK